MTAPRASRVLPLALLALAAGCDEPKKPSAQAPPPIQTRETLHKTTTTVLHADEELKKGAVLSDGKINDANPISGPGSAYVSAVGRSAVMTVNHSIDIYTAGSNDGKPPKDYDEFMEKVFKANNTALPMLPYYQEYGYDEKAHKLVVLEYPEKKAQREKERDAK